MTLLNAEFNYDLDYGFAWAMVGDKNIFQVCLMQSSKGGFKKQIDRNDCGHNDGICGDINGDNAEKNLGEFLKLARKNGIKIL